MSISGQPSRRPLVELYRQWIDEGRDGHNAPEIRAQIETRGELAARLFRLDAARMCPLEIDDQMERMDDLIKQPPDLDDPGHVAAQEVARVQRAVLQEELDRREERNQAAREGAVYVPARTDVLGGLIEMSRTLENEGEGSDPERFLAGIVAEAKRLQAESPTGIGHVVTLLEAAVDSGPVHEDDPLDAWVRLAATFELLTNPFQGFQGKKVDLDPVPLAHAVRAKRLFFAHGRQDPRYDEVDWPLDLAPDELIDLLRDHADASEAWSEQDLPEADLEHYLSPCRHEEPGRPPACAQIVSGEEAYERAHAAGGIRVPLVYPVAPDDRNRHMRRIWEEGIGGLSEESVGLPLYSAAGDNRVRWDAGPYPFGVLVAVAVAPEDILTLGRGDSIDDEQVFDRITRQVTDSTRGTDGYPAALRETLLEAGYRAVARYDYLDEETSFPQELILLDPDPERIVVIRETIPSFMRPLPPLAMPAYRHGRDADAPDRHIRR